MPLECERLKGCCCLPGKCDGVVSEKPIRGGDVKSVCSLGKGVYGGVDSGESITQLLRCERIRFVFDDMVTVVDI